MTLTAIKDFHEFAGRNHIDPGRSNARQHPPKITAPGAADKDPRIIGQSPGQIGMNHRSAGAQKADPDGFPFGDRGLCQRQYIFEIPVGKNQNSECGRRFHSPITTSR